MRTITRAFVCALLFGSAAAGQRLALWYQQPAEDWQSQALPIGNGRLGAMIFGDARREHLQLNEISLWTGDEKDTGRYQNLGDLFLDLTHGAPQSYRRYFSSAPQQVMVLRFTSDKRGAYTGTVRLTDAHGAPVLGAGSRLSAGGKLDNGLEYETQIQVVSTGGRVSAAEGALHIESADALTIFIAAGTNYLPDRVRAWRGDSPHARIMRQLAAAAAMSYTELRAAHIADYQHLFRRVALNLGSTGGSTVGDIPTDERLVRYRDGAVDPELEALFFQYGRYLLISSSLAQRLSLQHQHTDELLAGGGNKSFRMRPAVFRLCKQPAGSTNGGYP